MLNRNRIPGYDNKRLTQFIKREFGEFDDKWIKRIEKQRAGNSIFLSYRNFSSSPRVFIIKLNASKTRATLYNYDPEDDDEQKHNYEKIQIEIIVKSENQNLYIYKGQK